MIKKFVFKLKDGAPPYIDIFKIKAIINEDGYLDDRMRRLLILMKKARQTYLQLALSREVIVNDDEFYTLERSLDPLQGYGAIWIKNNNLETIKTDKSLYYKELEQTNDKLGYLKISEEEMKKEVLDVILKDIKFPEKEDDGK